MVARSSSAARSVSATSSSRCRSCTAASTWVLSVRCLPRALTRPRALKRSSIRSSGRCSAPPATRRGRDPGQGAEWNPRAGQLEPERVLPVDAGAHRVGGLAVAEVLEELEDRDQRQPPRREPGLAPGGIELAEVPVLVEGAELVAQPRDHGALGEGGAGDARGLGGDLADRFGMQAHGPPPRRRPRWPPEFADSISATFPRTRAGSTWPRSRTWPRARSSAGAWPTTSARSSPATRC